MEDLLPQYLMMGVSFERFMDSCPKELKPYDMAFEKQALHMDEQMWRMGLYVSNAVEFAVGRVLNGKKFHGKYIEEPILLTAKKKYKEEHLSEEEKITYTKQLFGKLEAMKEKFEKKSKSRNSDK